MSAEEIQTFDFLNGSAQAFSIKKEEAEINEDSYCCIESKSGAIVLAVADGMGGHEDGHYASSLIISEIAKVAKSKKSEGDILPQLLRAIQNSHQKIKKNKSDSGSTVVLAYIFKNFVRFVNIGDSLAFLLGGKKEIKAETIEHTPFGIARLLELKNDDEFQEQSHILLNAIGVDTFRIEVSPEYKLNKNDRVVLASDGLVDNLDYSSSTSLFYKKTGLFEIKKRVVRNRKDPVVGKNDDVTVVVFRRRK